MKPILLLFSAFVLVSCVSHPVEEVSPPDVSFVVDSNMGGKKDWYTLDQGQKWIFEANQRVADHENPEMLTIRQSWFEAMNNLSWSRSILARTLNYEVQWKGTVSYRGVTRSLSIAFVFTSRVESGRRMALNPVSFQKLSIRLDEVEVATSERLPARVASPYELFRWEGLPVTLAAIHGPFYEKPAPDRELALVSELTRTDLQLALTAPEGRTISGKTVVGWGRTDDLIWGAAANHVLSQMLAEMFN